MSIEDQIRALAARRMTRNAIAIEIGMTCSQIDRFMRVHNITTSGKRGVQPLDDGIPVHGVSGKPPAKLMPSADAVRCASIWSVAGGVGHASTLAAPQLVRQSVGSFTF